MKEFHGSAKKKLVLSYFEGRPGQIITSREATRWAQNEWQRRTGEDYPDPARDIRGLKDAGWLDGVKRGQFRYPGPAARD